MRMIRWYSRRTMVLKPIQRTRPRCIGSVVALSARMLRGSVPVPSEPRNRESTLTGKPLRAGCRRPKSFRTIQSSRDSLIHQAHEDLLQPIDLVPHAHHLDAGLRQAPEKIIEVLLVRDLDLEGVLIGQPHRIAVQPGRGRQGRADV